MTSVSLSLHGDAQALQGDDVVLCQTQKSGAVRECDRDRVLSVGAGIKSLKVYNSRLLRKKMTK